MNNNKIIFASVFACAAIISSLFIYHLSQKPVQTSLNSDYGVVFPAAREVKPFDLVSSQEQKFGLHDLYGHWTLMFFGFTHCSQICPNTLGMISKSYDALHAQYPNLQVVLISVDPERDTPDSLKNYTHNFNADFLAATGKINELRKLQSQLGIFSEKDQTATNGDYQIQHTSSIILINPQGKWAGIFKYGLSPAQFSEAFKQSMATLRG